MSLESPLLLVAALCMIFMILVSLKNVTKYSHVVALLPQRLKSTLFEIFSNGGCPKGTRSVETVHLSRKNETKIVKITHSVLVVGGIIIYLAGCSSLKKDYYIANNYQLAEMGVDLQSI